MVPVSSARPTSSRAAAVPARWYSAPDFLVAGSSSSFCLRSRTVLQLSASDGGPRVLPLIRTRSSPCLSASQSRVQPDRCCRRSVTARLTARVWRRWCWEGLNSSRRDRRRGAAGHAADLQFRLERYLWIDAPCVLSWGGRLPCRCPAPSQYHQRQSLVRLRSPTHQKRDRQRTSGAIRGRRGESTVGRR